MDFFPEWAILDIPWPFVLIFYVVPILCLNTSLVFPLGICTRRSSLGWQDVHHLWAAGNGVPERDILLWPPAQPVGRVCRGAGGAGMAWYGCCQWTGLCHWWQQWWARVPPRCSPGTVPPLTNGIQSDWATVCNATKAWGVRCKVMY